MCLYKYILYLQLITKINEELPNLEQCEETKQIEVHFGNTLQHIRNRMASTDTASLEISFAGIQLNAQVTI